MPKLLKIIDTVSRYTGGTLKWFIYALILVIVYDVTMRYVFNAPTMWAYETAIMIGGCIFVLGFSYAHLSHSHVRVDIFYRLFPPRRRATIDAMGTLFFLLPVLVVLIRVSFDWMWRAWLINEKSAETYWYPPIAPFRTVVLLGFCLLALQALAHLIRDFYFMTKDKPYG